MRGFVPDYELRTLPDLSQTLQALARDPSRWKLFAGGTDLMVLLEAGKLSHHHFLNLAPFQELKQIESIGTHLKIGALCTYTQIQNHLVIQKKFPLMARSGWVTGAKAIQNRGTIGGNIANASPAADTPPSLLAYGAQIELMSAQGKRVLDYSEFHLDYKKTVLRPEEIISAVLLPTESQWTHQYYRKVGTRAFQSISKVAISAAAQMENGIVKKLQIGLASVAPKPIRAQAIEKALTLQNLAAINRKLILQSLHHALAPIDDIRSTAEYRKAVLERVTAHLMDVLEKPPGLYLE
jgi:CO/xanthine dehydrogenase FAD-binding subunit